MRGTLGGKRKKEEKRLNDLHLQKKKERKKERRGKKRIREASKSVLERVLDSKESLR